MPVMQCTEEGKPGWKFGESGKCYTYTENDKQSEATAKLRAAKQGAAEQSNEKENK